MIEDVPSKAPMIAVIIVAVLQFVFFAAFGLFGYAIEKSNAQGHAPSMGDTLIYASPCLAIALFGALAVWACVSGRPGLGVALVFAPLILGAVLLQFLVV